MRTLALVLVLVLVGAAVALVLWLRPSTPGGGPGGGSLPADWPVTFEPFPGTEPRFERVILVSIDTLRADHVSSYGYVRKTTPFLDSLADRGVLFERSMAAVSHTAPSHATMLTGLPPALHGVLDNGMRLDEEAQTAAHLFAAAGFETAAMVNVEFLTAITNGFDHVTHRLLDGERILASTSDWLRRGRKTERFFLWVHIYAPHHWKRHDWTPAKYLARIHQESPLSGDEFYDYLDGLHGLKKQVPGLPFDLGWVVMDKKKGEVGTESRADFLGFIDAYDAQILHSDALLERLYETVESLGLGGNTLWIVTSDHGEGLASHEIAGHGSRIYQEQLHVPLVVHASDGSLGPRRVPDLVHHVDLLPTLAEVAGVTLRGVPELFEGRSLFPLMAGETRTEGMAFAQRRPMPPDGADTAAVFALQDGRHKYILSDPGPDEFYDLEADPLELENLAPIESPERERLRAALEERLRLYLQAGRGGEVSEEFMDELQDLGYVDR